MIFVARTFALATVLLAPFSMLRAETAADPSGHWEGAIHVPSGEVQVAVDVALDDAGKLAGTFSNPSQHLTGFPLWNVDRRGSVGATGDQDQRPGRAGLRGQPVCRRSDIVRATFS